MIRLKIPFHPNLKDNLHCFQASLMMVLSFFESDFKYSAAEIDRVTGFQKKRLTWNSIALLWLARKGYSVKDISDFDSEAFAKRGKAYLREYWRSDVYAVQNSESDLTKEQQLTKRLLQTERIKMIKKRPTLAMLEKHLVSGWLAIANIDISRLNNSEHYSPHSIVITGMSRISVFFHDPGSTSRQNRRVGIKKFAKVIQNGELILIKYPK